MSTPGSPPPCCAECVTWTDAKRLLFWVALVAVATAFTWFFHRYWGYMRFIAATVLVAVAAQWVLTYDRFDTLLSTTEQIANAARRAYA